MHLRLIPLYQYDMESFNARITVSAYDLSHQIIEDVSPDALIFLERINKSASNYQDIETLAPALIYSAEVSGSQKNLKLEN